MTKKVVTHGWMEWINGGSHSRHPVVVSGKTCWGIGPGGAMQWIFGIPDDIPTGEPKDVRMYYAVNPNMPQAWDMKEKRELTEKARETIGCQGDYTFDAVDDDFGWVDATIHLFCDE